MDSESEVEGEAGDDSEPAARATMEIDFTPPFKRLPILETLEERLGEKLPDVNSNGRRGGCLSSSDAFVRRLTFGLCMWLC